jgi:thiol-disulfide isomerase/thioredoxin
MRSLVKSRWSAALMAVCLVTCAEALAGDRPAETILKDIESVALPKLDMAKRTDRAYINQYVKAYQEAMTKRSALILELYKADPNHSRIPTLMVERWRSVNPGDPKFEDIITEIKEVAAQTKDPKFKLEATFAKAQVLLSKSRAGAAPDLSGVDEFVKLAPKDPRGANLLYGAHSATTDEAAKTALEDRIIKEYPDSKFVGMIKGGRRMHDAVGKPFELEFTDAIKGTTLSMNGALKGKVVVIDFWATWCGPCVAEMPKMKELYAKYRDQGVEFVGVSLDQPKEQGGLDKLKKYVADNKIEWPQYYMGKGWESEFSVSWGINSIPRVFIVDTEGKLHSVEARGKLEEMIPELLKKKNAPVGAAGGGL